MPYRYLEEIATADVAFSASGASREELFAASAAALLHVMIDNPDSIVLRERVTVDLNADQLDLLLFSFLQEFVFYKDARQLLLIPEEITISEADDESRLTVVLAGERLDPSRHHLGVDVKAVTLHLFRVERMESGWEATVILDI